MKITLLGTGEFNLDIAIAMAKNLLVPNATPILFKDLKNGDIFRFKNLNENNLDYSDNIYKMLDVTLQTCGQCVTVSNTPALTWFTTEKNLHFSILQSSGTWKSELFSGSPNGKYDYPIISNGENYVLDVSRAIQFGVLTPITRKIMFSDLKIGDIFKMKRESVIQNDIFKLVGHRSGMFGNAIPVTKWPIKSVSFSSDDYTCFMVLQDDGNWKETI